MLSQHVGTVRFQTLMIQNHWYLQNVHKEEENPTST